MLEITYENHLGEVFRFGDYSGVHLSDNELFNYSWDYSVSSSGEFQVGRKSRKIPLKILFADGDTDASDDFFEIVERDAVAGKVGTLTVGEYYLRGIFVIGERPYRNGQNGTTVRSMTFATAKQRFWIRDIIKSFSATQTKAAIVNEGFMESPVTITAIGPADSVLVSIGDNIYSVNQKVKAGEKLVIDGINKTITLIGEDGGETNVLHKREGKQVAGSGYYSFEPIAVGYNELTWQPKCDLYITVHEQSSEPRSK